MFIIEIIVCIEHGFAACLLYSFHKGYGIIRSLLGIKILYPDGISKAKKEGKYQGRKAISVDDTKLYEVWRKYENKKITLEEATSLLNISVSTFYRRIKKFQ